MLPVLLQSLPQQHVMIRHCTYYGKDMKTETEYSEEQAIHRAQIAEKYGFIDIRHGMFYPAIPSPSVEGILAIKWVLTSVYRNGIKLSSIRLQNRLIGNSTDFLFCSISYTYPSFR